MAYGSCRFWHVEWRAAAAGPTAVVRWEGRLCKGGGLDHHGLGQWFRHAASGMPQLTDGKVNAHFQLAVAALFIEGCLRFSKLGPGWALSN